MEKDIECCGNGFSVDFDEKTRTITHYADDDVEAYLWGFLVDVRLPETGIDNQFEIIKEIAAQKENFDFNNLHGAFKVCIRNLKTQEIILLNDNPGSQMFFIDLQENRISDRFLKLVSNRNGMLQPNYTAISLFLKYGFLITEDTIVKDIFLTKAEFFYVIQGTQVQEVSKKLIPLWEKSQYEMALGDLMKSITKKLDYKDVCAIATGGTDSRVVLAHLLSLGMKPNLFISGRKTNPDVVVAEKVGKATECDLKVYDPDNKEPGWISLGFEFSDGIYDSILSYRQFRLASMAADGNYLFEFGGIGGEFYKNGYCHFIKKRYFSDNISDERVREGTYRTKLTPAWFGPKVKACRQEEEEKINKIVAENNHGKVLARLNCVRLQLLRRMFSSVTNNYARYCTKIDPLMDRSVISTVSQDSPIPHCMFCWHRREITKVYPNLAGVETDTGLSCRYTVGAVVRDALVDSYKRVMNKLLHKKRQYWENDFIEGVKSPEYAEAEKICKELGLIDEASSSAQIPSDQYGRIITIGKIFESKADLNMQVEE